MDTGIFEEPDIQELIAFRKIRPEDHSIIYNLSRFNKTELTANFHNFFLNHRENSINVLAQAIAQYDAQLEQNPGDEQIRRLREICEWYIDICRNYDWATANNINRVLERIDLTKYQ